MTTESKVLLIEDLKVYRMLCDLHLAVCKLTLSWPAEERYELGSQVRRSSNSAPSQLAEKNDDRHIRNKIEGVNRARGETAETIHHLYIACMKGYITRERFDEIRSSYNECVRMLNGLEKSLERYIPDRDRRWGIVHEKPATYDLPDVYSEPPINNVVELSYASLNTET